MSWPNIAAWNEVKSVCVLLIGLVSEGEGVVCYKRWSPLKYKKIGARFLFVLLTSTTRERQFSAILCLSFMDVDVNQGERLSTIYLKRFKCFQHTKDDQMHWLKGHNISKVQGFNLHVILPSQTKITKAIGGHNYKLAGGLFSRKVPLPTSHNTTITQCHIRSFLLDNSSNYGCKLQLQVHFSFARCHTCTEAKSIFGIRRKTSCVPNPKLLLDVYGQARHHWHKCFHKKTVFSSIRFSTSHNLNAEHRGRRMIQRAADL